MDEIQSIIQKIKDEKEWKIELATINYSKSRGTQYHIDELNGFEPNGEKKIVDEIINTVYSGEIEEKYSCVEKYSGIVENNKIYKLSTDDKIIKEEYDNLLDALAEVNTENIVLKKGKYSFTIFKANSCPLKVISVGEPITSINNGFFLEKSAFKRVPNKIVTIKNKIDVIINEKQVYLLTNAGERVFNFERSFKKVAKEYIEEIVKANIVNDSELFTITSSSGHNPRKLVSFNYDRLNKMSNNPSVLKSIAKKCKLKLDGEFVDTTDPENSELLIKILCSKVQEDLFDHIPVEVDSSKLLFKE